MTEDAATSDLRYHSEYPLIRQAKALVRTLVFDARLYAGTRWFQISHTPHERLTENMSILVQV
jgi:hypothetical protein